MGAGGRPAADLVGQAADLVNVQAELLSDLAPGLTPEVDAHGDLAMGWGELVPKPGDVQRDRLRQPPVDGMDPPNQRAMAAAKQVRQGSGGDVAVTPETEQLLLLTREQLRNLAKLQIVTPAQPGHLQRRTGSARG